MTTPSAERVEMLVALVGQLPRLTDRRARERTKRAIQRLEVEIAPGRARESEVLR